MKSFRTKIRVPLRERTPVHTGYSLSYSDPALYRSCSRNSTESSPTGFGPFSRTDLHFLRGEEDSYSGDSRIDCETNHDKMVVHSRINYIETNFQFLVKRRSTCFCS